MGLMLTLAFLFCIGSMLGWVIELLFRHYFSRDNPERKWINPGFCMGPYLPLYGFGLCFLYLIASTHTFFHTKDTLTERLLLFVAMAVTMTVIEYIAGILCLRVFHVRLWDYSHEWGNIQGIICPKFSFFWAVLGAVYYFLIHPHILEALDWLSRNLAVSFVIGMFYGVFIIDVVHSSQIITKLRTYAQENDIIVRYERMKAHIRSVQEKKQQKYHFFLPFRTERPFHEYLREHRSHLVDEFRKNKNRKNSPEDTEK